MPIEPVDEAALAEAERDLSDGAQGTTLDEAAEDDWGPGAGG